MPKARYGPSSSSACSAQSKCCASGWMTNWSTSMSSRSTRPSAWPLMRTRARATRHTRVQVSEEAPPLPTALDRAESFLCNTPR